jgi:hypothetical protein
MAKPDKRDPYEERILSRIKEDGFFYATVYDMRRGRPPFSYTVGFTQKLKCPEFIVFGLDDPVRSKLVRDVFQLIKKGKVPADNQRWSELLEGYDCICRAVHPTNVTDDYFRSALWYLDRSGARGPLQAYQLFWPSNGPGLFPWEEGCSQEVRDLQPLLYEPNRPR